MTKTRWVQTTVVSAVSPRIQPFSKAKIPSSSFLFNQLLANVLNL